MSGSVLFLVFFSDLLLLFPSTIDLCAPPHEPIYHGAACTVRYISHPYPSAMKYCGARSLSLSLTRSVRRSLAVSLAHLMAPPPGTINSTPDIIVVVVVVVGPHNGKSRYKIYSPPGPIDIIDKRWTRWNDMRLVECPSLSTASPSPTGYHSSSSTFKLFLCCSFSFCGFDGQLKWVIMAAAGLEVRYNCDMLRYVYRL